MVNDNIKDFVNVMSASNEERMKMAYDPQYAPMLTNDIDDIVAITAQITTNEHIND